MYKTKMCFNWSELFENQTLNIRLDRDLVGLLWESIQVRKDCDIIPHPIPMFPLRILFFDPGRAKYARRTKSSRFPDHSRNFSTRTNTFISNPNRSEMRHSSRRRTTAGSTRMARRYSMTRDQPERAEVHNDL